VAQHWKLFDRKRKAHVRRDRRELGLRHGEERQISEMEGGRSIRKSGD